jgi:hypothetical protein
MKRNPASKASRRQTLLRIALKKAERRLESRRKQRAHQLEVYANPNSGQRAIYTAPRMNGNFRPDSWAVQFHRRAEKAKNRRPRVQVGKSKAALLGAPVERHV